LHLVLWCAEEKLELLREKWLALWSVSNCEDHKKYSVKWRAADAGWFGYVALHQGKHDSAQSSGWRGRHWGVLSKDLLRLRVATEWKLSDRDYDRFRALMSRVLMSRGRSRPLPGVASWDCIGGDYLTARRCVEKAQSGHYEGDF
jgi:hypothetical protein